MQLSQQQLNYIRAQMQMNAQTPTQQQQQAGTSQQQAGSPIIIQTSPQQINLSQAHLIPQTNQIFLTNPGQQTQQLQTATIAQQQQVQQQQQQQQASATPKPPDQQVTTAN